MPLNAEVLRSSFALVLERAPDVTHQFYDVLFQRYPQAKPLFSPNGRERQEKMLAEALVAVVDHLEDAPWLESQLKALGAKHIDYGVTPEMYSWVGDALIATFSKIAGAEWTPTVQSAWVEAYGAISSLMLSGAKSAELDRSAR